MFLQARTNSQSAHFETVCNKRTFSCGCSAEDTLYLETRDYCVLLLQLLMPYGWLIPYMSNLYELVSATYVPRSFPGLMILCAVRIALFHSSSISRKQFHFCNSFRA